jgi:tetratricopeptide (TPR) repeat protein
VPGSIVNPAKLAGKERDSVCEQCHVEGATTVLNPGKDWWDFKPGQALEETQATYIIRSGANESEEVAAVSHAEQLALSACKRANPGKLWCATCHDPHSPAGDHKPEIGQVCRTCHAPLQLSVSHRSRDGDCISCHMPKLRATDISHAAITDHRIPKHPNQHRNSGSELPAAQVVPWRPPDPSVAQRDLALALFNLARMGKPQGDYPKAFSLLVASAPGKSDAAPAAAQGYMLLGSGHAQAAVALFRRAVQSDGQSAEYWLDLGVAEQAAGDSAAAENAMRESIRREPSDYRSYEALSGLLNKEGKKDDAKEVVREFMRLNPQSIVMRLRHGS